MEEKIKVAKIVVGENTYYTDDLNHPKAANAEVIEMTREQYREIPASLEAHEFFKQN